MSRRQLGFIFGFSLLLSDAAFPQDSLKILVYPSESDLSATVKPEVSQSMGLFKYLYTVVNSNSSGQKVWQYSVFNVPDFDSLRSPVGWDVGTSTIPAQRVTWAASDSVYEVFPGGTVAGFAIISRGLPSIKDFYATGWTEVPKINVERDSIIGGLFPENSFHGTTVGPTAPPAHFSSLVFLDTMQAALRRSRSLGWITTEPTARKYADYFRNLRSQIQSGYRTRALTILQTIVSETNRDSSSTLKSEAYVLIRYSAQYFRDELVSTQGR